MDVGRFEVNESTNWGAYPGNNWEMIGDLLRVGLLWLTVRLELVAPAWKKSAEMCIFHSTKSCEFWAEECTCPILGQALPITWLNVRHYCWLYFRQLNAHTSSLFYLWHSEISLTTGRCVFSSRRWMSSTDPRFFKLKDRYPVYIPLI